MTDQIIQHLKTTTKTDDKPSNPTTPTSAQQTRSEDQRDRQNQPQLKQPSIKPTPAKQQPASNSLSVVINLAKVDQKVKERMGEFTAAQLKERTESAIAEAGVEELKDVRIRGVKMIRKNNDVVVQAFSEKQAENLLKHADTWMEIFAQNARPKRRHFKIVARAVPTSFDPKAGGAKQSLYLDNAGTIPSPSSIADVRWVNPKKALAGNGRTRSTLVLTLTNQRAADELIYRSVSVAGAICDSDQFVPDPKSCHLCHTLEHIAPACPHQNNPERWLCGRCSHNHLTSQCKCPKNICTDMRTCTHIIFKCACCGGDHKAVDPSCPKRQAAKAEAQQRASNGSRFFDPNFDPRASSAGRC